MRGMPRIEESTEDSNAESLGVRCDNPPQLTLKSNSLQPTLAELHSSQPPPLRRARPPLIAVKRLWF